MPGGFGHRPSKQRSNAIASISHLFSCADSREHGETRGSERSRVERTSPDRCISPQWNYWAEWVSAQRHRLSSLTLLKRDKEPVSSLLSSCSYLCALFWGGCCISLSSETPFPFIEDISGANFIIFNMVSKTLSHTEDISEAVRGASGPLNGNQALCVCTHAYLSAGRDANHLFIIQDLVPCWINRICPIFSYTLFHMYTRSSQCRREQIQEWIKPKQFYLLFHIESGNLICSICTYIPKRAYTVYADS